jgi:hypothetical protein
MKYTTKMRSGSMTYIPIFIKTGSRIQKLAGEGIYIQTHKQQGNFISILLFFQSEESRLKTDLCKSLTFGTEVRKNLDLI